LADNPKGEVHRGGTCDLPFPARNGRNRGSSIGEIPRPQLGRLCKPEGKEGIAIGGGLGVRLNLP